MGVDSTQYSTTKITVSANKALDKMTGYAIGADKTFRFDDTNHTKLPIGTTNLVADQKEYSFLTDEQGNRILTLTRIEVKDSQGNWTKLTPIDQTEVPIALDEFESTTGTPQYYDKISDNVIRLYPAASTSVTSGLKFYFQRSPHKFETTDTTAESGFTPELDDYIVTYAALEGAVALGLPNLTGIKLLYDEEKERMVQYFTRRNEDEQPPRMTGAVINCV
jgi:hypothetical protein